MRSIFMAVAAILLWAQSLAAGQMTKVMLEPISHVDAALVVVGADGSETRYSPADLEKFTTYRMVTTTPWREEPAAFEGVLLSEILAANGLSDAVAIRVTAENDYSTSMSKELLESVEILVATRVDGRPHSRRARGPIQFVIDAQTYAASPLTQESNFVWMAARIEAED